MLTRQMPLGRGHSRPPGAPTGVMGILNLTPDSFSDGGDLASRDAVVARGREMARQGACVLDVGGESTRPGAEDVPVEEELRRVVPAIRELVARVGLPVSIDTRKAEVFVAAWEAGASILNDVTGLAFDPVMAEALGRTEAAAILMHGRGDPRSMDGLADYGDVVAEVSKELLAAVARAEAAGVSGARLVLDPGIGFAKDAEQNWELLRGIDALRALGYPLLVGASRKRFLGSLTGHEDPLARDPATAALSALLALRSVEMLRVHAVSPTVDAVRTAVALAGSEAAAEVGP